VAIQKGAGMATTITPEAINQWAACMPG